jgi:hypothetical protein
VDRPMRVYGLNVVEQTLDDVLVAVGWLLAALALVAGILAGTFGARGTAGGLLLAATAIAGVLLALGGSGVRQNGAATDLGFAALAVAGAGWMIAAITVSSLAALLTGLTLALLFALLCALRRRALRARFKPRFLSLRQFGTMIAIADTMIDGDGREAMHPIEVAVGVDHMLARVESPTTAQLRLVLILTEWALPLLIFRPFPFSVLGTNDRRRAVQKVINAKGLFKDVARSLKVLACSGYYADPRGIASTGFVDFESRPRHAGLDETPFTYPDPFAGGDSR